jgi:hypothetical protein
MEYNGHKLESTPDIHYDYRGNLIHESDNNAEYFKCKACGIIIFKQAHTGDFNISCGNKTFGLSPSLSCNEIILLKIL